MVSDAKLGLLELSKVPVGTVNNLEEVFSDPHVIARNLKINMKHKNAKTSYTESVRTPIIFSDTKLNYSRGVPALGEHSDEILKELDDAKLVIVDLEVRLGDEVRSAPTLCAKYKGKIIPLNTAHDGRPILMKEENSIEN